MASTPHITSVNTDDPTVALIITAHNAAVESMAESGSEGYSAAFDKVFSKMARTVRIAASQDDSPEE